MVAKTDPIQDAMVERMFTINEVAAALQIGRSTCKKLIYAEKIRSTRIGRQVRVRESWLNEYIRSLAPNSYDKSDESAA